MLDQNFKPDINNPVYVEVRYCEDSAWYKRILREITDDDCYCIENTNDDGGFEVVRWKYWREIPQENTKDKIIKLLKNALELITE